MNRPEPTSPTAKHRRIRVFISSPADVSWAREVAAQVIEKLAQDYSRDLDAIEPYLWEHEAMLASGHFQDSIEPPSAFDIVIVIVWSRLGSRLPAKTSVRAYRGLDGRTGITGTEWEFEDALASARFRGSPDLLVFRSLQPATLEMADPAKRKEQLSQAQALEQFWSRHFSSESSPSTAFTTFETDEAFALGLERQLRALLEKRIRSLGTASALRRTWRQAPFRGLEAYEFEHAAIFFGRDEAVGVAISQLSSAARSGRAFLMVVGPSGSGKSSLAKAGVVPKLFVPRRITGVGFLRRVEFRPSDAVEGEDIFDAFARRLTAPGELAEGLGELIPAGGSPGWLAEHLRAGGDPTYPFHLLIETLTARGRRGGQLLAHESARVALVVDQFEELFADERVSEEQRSLFIDLLARLSASGLVWTIATLRADFWHRVLESPQLSLLCSGPSRMDLAYPSAVQLGQMIRRPALAAGLEFEVDRASSSSLNEIIAAEVARQAGALPLLSYLLGELYRVDVLEGGGDRLTLESYRRLGGLEGAVATRADAIVDACGPEARQALGPVLFSLVQGGGAEGEVLARRAPLASFEPGSPRRRLVDALLAARLLVVDAAVATSSTVRVAHEALLTSWTRARNHLSQYAEALKLRRRIEERFERWREASTAPTKAEPRFWRLASFREPPSERGLLTDLDLSDAVRLQQAYADDLDEEISSYIKRSLASDKRRRGRVVRRLVVVSSVVTLLAAAAAMAALVARNHADQLTAAQSRLLTGAAADRLKGGDPLRAEAIMLEVAAMDGAQKLTPRAVTVFLDAVAADRALAIFAGHAAPVQSATFSPDGRRILTASRDRTARIWDASTGVPLLTLSGGDGYVLYAAFSPNSRRVVTASEDGDALVWNASTGAPELTLRGTGILSWAGFSPDGLSLASASEDGTVRLWDAKSGRQVGLFKIPDSILSATFSPDGRRLALGLANGLAQVVDLPSGAARLTLRGHGGPVTAVAYSADGALILTASGDRTARVWNSVTGASVQVLSGHGDGVSAAAFSPDGRLVVTACLDKVARVFDWRRGAQVLAISGHEGVLNDASFSPDGAEVVTASSDGDARSWLVAPRGQLAQFGSGAYAVQKASFSPDGQALVMASLDRSARVWGWRAQAPAKVLSGHSGAVIDASFARDGRRVVTAAFDMTARIWDAVGGQPLAVLRGHTGALTSAAFSPDGRWIISSSGDGTAREWEANDGRQVRVFAARSGVVMSAAFSPDGLQIVTASADHTARLWNLETGANVVTLFGHAGVVESAVFSPDGRRVLTASEDMTTRLWNAKSGALLCVLTGHAQAVNSAVFSPDGRFVLTASDDRTARLWDGSRCAQVALVAVLPDGVNSAAFSPDGTVIATASDDGMTRIWRTPEALSLRDEVDWARAAQIDFISGVDREELGLPSPPRPLWLLRPARRRVMELAVRAESEALQAVSEVRGQARDSRLLQAFVDYARAVREAPGAQVPSADWQVWRRRQASLARVLRGDRMSADVAAAYRRAVAG